LCGLHVNGSALSCVRSACGLHVNGSALSCVYTEICVKSACGLRGNSSTLRCVWGEKKVDSTAAEVHYHPCHWLIYVLAEQALISLDRYRNQGLLVHTASRVWGKVEVLIPNNPTIGRWVEVLMPSRPAIRHWVEVLMPNHPASGYWRWCMMEQSMLLTMHGSSRPRQTYELTCKQLRTCSAVLIRALQLF